MAGRNQKHFLGFAATEKPLLFFRDFQRVCHCP